MRKICFTAFLVMLCIVLQAQNDDRHAYETDTLGKQKNLQALVLPVLFYTPETSVGFGVGSQLFLLRESNTYNSRLSNMFVSVIYTANKQLIIDVQPKIYFDRGDYFLDMGYKFKVFPNSFWGIGNTTPEGNKEVYSMTSSEFRVAVLKRLPPNLNFGFEYVLEFHDVTDTEEGGILESGDVVGSDKAIISGIGAIFNLDSRDNTSSPNSGHFLQLNARFSSELFGATTGFNKYIFDLRTYRPLGKKSIVAIQLYSETTFGEIPFQGQSWYGGGERARGYFRGRFIDNNLYVLQAEYRWRFMPRWVLAGFVLVGEVADLPRNFFADLKPSFGGGVRFQITKSQQTLLRLDVGFGKDGSGGIYFGVDEAF